MLGVAEQWRGGGGVRGLRKRGAWGRDRGLSGVGRFEERVLHEDLFAWAGMDDMVDRGDMADA